MEKHYEGVHHNQDVVFRDEFTSVGFAQVSYVILRDTRLSLGAKLVYQILLSYAMQKGECFPGQDRIADDIGINVRTVREHLTELKNFGLISYRKRGFARTNLYIIENPRSVYMDKDNPNKLSKDTLLACNFREKKFENHTRAFGEVDREGNPCNYDQMSPAWNRVSDEMPERKVLYHQQEEQKEEQQVKEQKVELTETERVRNVMAEAYQKNKEASAKKIQKDQAKITKRIDFAKLRNERKRSKIGFGVLEDFWSLAFQDVFDAPFGGWDLTAKSIVKQMLANYGGELVKKVFESVLYNWEGYSQRFKANGSPTVNWVWAYRDTLFPEIKTGKVIDGKRKTRKKDADEYQTSNRPAPDIGW